MAGVLLASLLPVSFATGVQTAQHTSSYAGWVEAQLREPADETVQKALEVAAASRSRSLEAFLTVFVEAYEAQQPETPLARVFSPRSLSNEALIIYLQGCYIGLVNDAVLPRTVFVTVQALSKQALKRWKGTHAVLRAHRLAHSAWTQTVRPSVVPVFVLMLRSLSTAQPLGP
ncbi:MAG: hypothetical protein ACE5G0_13275 [Rhodothermales bacterium]